MLNTEEKYEIQETIYRSYSSIIFKAKNNETKEKVIIKTLNRELYDSLSLAKLKNEYKLLKKLQGDYVIKALEFINVENRFSMVIEDFGGASLDRYLKTTQVGIRELLDIALKITKCLAYLNKKQVIHKDINPSNIVYNPENKVIKLIDFGIASEFSFETMQALNPHKLEGTLPYLSPEQTGRMNRPLDYRTDFYSLGVTLYEMCCAKLPFLTNDPAQLVHSHIAITPLPVHEVNSRIPKILSGIITKLMAKIPEERYKNANGILFDLDRCLKEPDNTGNIEEFALGLGDISDKLEMPKKIYGRKQELASLLASYQNISNGNAEFILIGGYSGIGKTSLVNELHKPIAQEQGMFISGKYDQYNRNIPYSAFFQAVDQFCRYILAEPEIEIERWKKRILETLGSKASLIIEVVPRLELIVGEQPVIKDLSPLEKQVMFKIALKNWLLAISSTEHPVVLFMDDVQWADMASLDLFENIFLDSAIKGLLFIGAYRNNEVNASHPLVRSIEKIKKKNGVIEFIQLGNLDNQAVGQMISEMVYRPEEEVVHLAKAVFERTLGNPFYTIEFLKHCNEENLLSYDQSEMQWNWNETGIRSSKISDNVADYLIGKIATLPAATQELVTLAACIGNHFNIRELSALAGKDAGEIEEWLKPAIYEEMIYVSGKIEDAPSELQFRFCHDKFQQAGYQVLADENKKAIHRKIARYYHETEKQGDNSTIFVIAEHYSKALDILAAHQEIEHVIEIFLKAARAAILSSSFEIARRYLELIMEITPEKLKNDNSFMLRIYVEYHLVLYSLAMFEELDRIYHRIEQIVADPLDLVDSCCVQVISLSNRSRYEEAFFLGVSLLEKLGLNYPKGRLINVVEVEIEKYYEYERNGKIEKIEEEEFHGQVKEKAIAKLLNRIMPAGFFFNPLDSYWTILVNINLMVENGLTPWGVETSAGLSLALIPFRNDFSKGYNLVKKAILIAENRSFISELYRMYHIYGIGICHWHEPLENDIDYAHKAYSGNLQNGEFEFSCYSFFTSQVAILECCNTLSEMSFEVEAALSLASKMGNLFALPSFVTFRQLVKALKGETFAFGCFYDQGFSDDTHLEEIKHNTIGQGYYYLYRGLSAVLFGDFPTALPLLEKAKPGISFMSGFYTVALHNFLCSLAICKTIDGIEDSIERDILQKTLAENQAWLYQRAQDAPFNFRHLYELVDAEIKITEKKYNEAFRLYEKAMLGAKENNRPYHYALACELAGQRYLQLEIKETAGFYLKKAYSAYLAWEATGKTEAMKEQYPQFLFSGMDSKKLKLSSEYTILTNSCDIKELSDSIDLEAIIKAAQTISGEIKKEKLLAKLMSIIIENSGGNRGYILLREGKRWALSAFTIVNGIVENFIDNQEIIPDSLETKPLLPFSLITYVVRTKEPVIIGNTLDNQFSSDNYFSGKNALSAICFPILSQNLLKGIIYLENDLLTEAFNQERLELLNILAAQAAISLENSLLYTELEDKVTERTKQLQEALSKLEEQHEKLKSTQLKLVQSEKMAGLGTLVAGVAHEINNPINYLYLSSRTLEKDLVHFNKEVLEIITGNDEEIISYFEDNFAKFHRALKYILDGSNRIKTIVQDLRTFSRLEEAEKKEVSLAEALELNIRLVKTQYKKEIEFVTDFMTNGIIECYPAQLNQVFLNIIVNSCQAILQKQKADANDGQGKVRVILWDNGKELVTTIEDNGCGMTEEVRARLFEPFYTSKPVGQGTGLGMSISYGIIKKHKGKIEVESKLGKGTIVTIFLPYII
jgi:predicted ATPase/signal transduction histidine kinase/tRNA A-37 threonylcarbamoyl transferase component Bud32